MCNCGALLVSGNYVGYYEHSFVSGQYFAAYASDFLHLKCMVLTFIIFLETALVSMCISLKSYSMEINNLKKVLILPAVSGNMSMLYDLFVCIN